MTEYVTGQIYGWNGGECPVHPETKIKIWTRNALLCSGVNADVPRCEWKHKQNGHDIIAFQVITPYAEPETVWVNEFLNGAMECFRSEAEAKQYGKQYHTRVAVKYVEEKK